MPHVENVKEMYDVINKEDLVEENPQEEHLIVFER
jgi:hypothetical protein